MWKYLTEKSIRHRFAKSRKIRTKRFVPYREASTIVVLADMQGAQQVGEALRVIGSEGKKIDYLPVAYLVASSNAPMRLGLKKDSLAPADIMVQLESEQATAEGLLRNLLFYWKNIAVKNNNS